jgi:hypothetical protein
MYIYLFNNFNPKNKESREKMYGTRELELKIDHKISSTECPKERCSENNKKINRLEVAGNSIIVAEEIVIAT